MVVNEYDYEDGTAGCTVPYYPGVTIWDISQGLDNGTLVKHMKITHTGENGNLAEPEGVKIAPDGETVYMTLQNQTRWDGSLFSALQIHFRITFLYECNT